jgi:unspecific monooxygenase
MAATSAAEKFFVDAMTPAFREDPYPLYDAYRTPGRLLRVDETIWFSLAHSDVTALLHDPRLSSDETRATTESDRPAPGAVKGRSLLFMDPPDHTRLRGLVVRAFTPRRIEGLRTVAETITIELLDDVVSVARDGAVVDAIGSLAYPLPVRVICVMLGVPASEQSTFTSWSRALARSIDPSVLRTAEDDAAIAEAEVGLDGFLGDLLAFRRATPGDDLLSALLAVEADGDRISHGEVVDLAMLLLIAGHETTVNLIGNAILALIGSLDQLSLLQHSPDLIAGAVEELLRFDSPVQLTQRVVTEDADVLGCRVRSGDEIMLVLGAANRDPFAFPQPDHLDIRRDARRHVAFGGGIHHCLGAALARLEGQVALAGFLARFDHVELAGEPVRRPTFTLRGLERLPLALDASD